MVFFLYSRRHLRRLGVGFAGYIYFILHTLSLLYCKRFLLLCIDLHVFFMTFFYKAISRDKLLCLCSVHLPITRVRLSFYVYLMH